MSMHKVGGSPSPIPRSAKGWRRVAEVAKRVGAILVEEAPTVLLLRKDSPKIMWALTVWTLSRKIAYQISGEKISHWTSGSWHSQRAILMAAMLLEIGETASVPDVSVSCRKVGGCLFGANEGSIMLPREGSIDDFLEALWGAAGGCFAVTMENDNFTLLPATAEAHAPSGRTHRIAEDCRKLQAAGHRVGVLLDGPPGTGKSEALRYVGSQLGGRVLRATLKASSRTIVADFVKLLRPDAVILDDVDRMDSESALDAVDQILATGCAVLATSNDQSKVCGALLRSGRIDLHHVYGGCEPDLFARLTEGLSDHQVALLRGSTVATIVRHNELAETIGAAKAERYVLQGKADDSLDR